MQLFYQIVQQASFEKIQNSGEWFLLYSLIFKLEKHKDLLFPRTLEDFLNEFVSLDGKPHMSYGVTVSKQLHLLLRLLVANPSIKFDRKFEEFNIKAEYSLSERIRLDSYNESIILHYQNVRKCGIVKHQGIRGDGNCYYGSIAYDVLRRIILYPKNQEFASNTYEQFRAAGDLIKEYYPDELKPLQRSHLQMMQSLFDKDGKFKLNFIHDLDRLYLNDKDFYLPLIRSCRMLLATAVESNQQVQFNELSLQKAILLSQAKSIDEWIKCNILSMGECAEGAPVELGLLPSLFDLQQHMFIIARDREYHELPEKKDKYSSEKYIYLLFNPGHYDLFNFYELQEKIDNNRSQFSEISRLECTKVDHEGAESGEIANEDKDRADIIESSSSNQKQCVDGFVNKSDDDIAAKEGEEQVPNSANSAENFSRSDGHSEIPTNQGQNNSKNFLSVSLQMAQACISCILKLWANFILLLANQVIPLINCLNFNLQLYEYYQFNSSSSSPC